MWEKKANIIKVVEPRVVGAFQVTLKRVVVFGRFMQLWNFSHQRLEPFSCLFGENHSKSVQWE